MDEVGCTTSARRLTEHDSSLLGKRKERRATSHREKRRNWFSSKPHDVRTGQRYDHPSTLFSSAIYNWWGEKKKESIHLSFFLQTKDPFSSFFFLRTTQTDPKTGQQGGHHVTSPSLQSVLFALTFEDRNCRKWICFIYFYIEMSDGWRRSDVDHSLNRSRDIIYLFQTLIYAPRRIMPEHFERTSYRYD